MKEFLVSQICKLAFHTGIAEVLKRKLNTNEVVVLSFHRITDEKDEFWPATSPADFTRIVDYCKRNFTLTTFSGLENLSLSGIKKPPLIFSFDDGYKDFLENALPVLKAYNVPANHNIVTGCVDNNRTIWTQKLNLLFAHLKRTDFKGNLSLLNQDFKFPPRNNRWKATYMDVFLMLLNNPFNDRDHIIDVWAAKVGFDFPLVEMMNWEDIRHCIKNGIEIGSHTVSHTVLSELQDEHEIMHELQQSKKTIEAKTGIQCDVFAFPNGKHENHHIELALKAGYKYILLVDDKHYNFEPENITHVVPRINMPGENFENSAMRMLLFHKKLRNLLH